MKITVNEDDCIGCGLCASLADGIFEIDDNGKSKVVGTPDDSSRDAATEAADNCPVGAITVQ